MFFPLDPPPAAAVLGPLAVIPRPQSEHPGIQGGWALLTSTRFRFLRVSVFGLLRFFVHGLPGFGRDCGCIYCEVKALSSGNCAAAAPGGWGGDHPT